MNTENVCVSNLVLFEGQYFTLLLLYCGPDESENFITSSILQISRRALLSAKFHAVFERPSFSKYTDAPSPLFGPLYCYSSIYRLKPFGAFGGENIHQHPPTISIFHSRFAEVFCSTGMHNELEIHTASSLFLELRRGNHHATLPAGGSGK